MKELLARLKAFPLVTVELLIATLFLNVLALASPLFVMQVLNRYVSYGVDSTLAALTVGVVVAVLFEFLFRRVRHRLAEAISKSFDKRLSTYTYSLLLDAKVGALNRVTPGMRREIAGGVAAIQQATGAANLTSLLDVPFSVLFILVLFLISWPVALLVCLFVCGLLLYSALNQRAMMPSARRAQAAMSKRNVLLALAVQAADTIRAFNAKGFMREKWDKVTEDNDKAAYQAGWYQASAMSVTQGLQGLMSAGVIALGAILVVAGHMDVGAMIGANILAARAMMPISKMAQMNQSFAKSRQAANLIADAGRMPREKTEGTGLQAYKGALEFKDMAFAYAGAPTPLFESMTAKLEAGSFLAVAGANSSGKTTLARLLVGLIEPSRGQILAGGVDLNQVAPEWWRKQLIYMPQEPKFLEATLAENLQTANPDIDHAGMRQALVAAALGRFVDEHPDGLDMMLRNNGEELSLGVRRRLALARALVNDGVLAILDEPTEGLDGEGCKAVYALLEDLKAKGRTVIVFSHDPNILKQAAMVLDLNSKPTPRFLKVTQPDPGQEETPPRAASKEEEAAT